MVTIQITKHSFDFLRMLSETSDSNDGMENSTFPDYNEPYQINRITSYLQQ